MTASDAGRTDATPEPAPIDQLVRPMPRLGRGLVWSDVVAEIQRDLEERTRDAA
jgi:hypothetical protein